MKMKWIGIMSVVLMLQSFPISLAQGEFNDTNGHWAEEAINALKKRQLVTGYEDGSYRPGQSVTRAEFVTVMTRALDIKDKEEFDEVFSDVPVGHWATASITVAKQMNLVSGFPDGRFRPNSPITRAEAATVIDKVFESHVSQPSTDFPDVSPNHWARRAITNVSAKGIATGDDKGLFHPNRVLSRAEFSVMLWRVLNKAPDSQDDQYIYTLELERWGVYNDGTHPVETTRGINDALSWAQVNGYTTFKVPEGNYLIAKGTKASDPEARINMVSNMTLELHEDAVLQKESNTWETYEVIYIGGNVENAVVRGGTIRGDRDTHDYSQKGINTGGTHEWGTGINIAGAENVIIENMTIEKFTGDGISIGGVTITGSYLTEEYMELGGLDARGRQIPAKGKIRTVGRIQTNFDKPAYKTHRNVYMWLPKGLSSNVYDICFYREDNSFISCDTDRKVYSIGSKIPEEADFFRSVFMAPDISGVNVNRMTIDNSRNVIIRNNDIGYNRRQGITAGGENVQILNNNIHHTSGTAPQSGIDIEPGFYPAIGHLIKGNEFYNNKIQVVLAYGEDATIEDNFFKQENLTGSVGLYVHEGYRGVVFNNNRFDGSGLTLRPNDVTASGNKFQNSSVTLRGGNILFKDALLTDSSLSLGEKSGTMVKNITIVNSGVDHEHKGTLLVWGEPVTIQGLTFKGFPVRGMFSGYGDTDTVFSNLVVEDVGESNLPSGKYIGCSFSSSNETTESLQVNYPDTLIEKCQFNDVTLRTNNEKNTLTVKDSEFTYDGDLSAPPVYAISTANILVKNNKFFAENLSKLNHPIIKLGRYAWTNHDVQVLAGAVIGNEIYTNIEVKGIHTSEAGIGAPPYTVTNNKLNNAILMLKEADVQDNNNVQKP